MNLRIQSDNASSNLSDDNILTGEYIDFTIGSVESGEHKFQATEVSGVNGCKLMCETRNESFRSRTDSRPQHQQGDKDTTRRRYQRADAPPPEGQNVQRSFPRQRQPPSSEEGASSWSKVAYKTKSA